MYMEDKMYSFTSALSAAAVVSTLLPKETGRKKQKFLRKQARRHPTVREAVAGVCVALTPIKLKENKMYLHYCDSISMSWRSLLSVQMAKVCIRVNKHDER